MACSPHNYIEFTRFFTEVATFGYMVAVIEPARLDIAG